MGCINVPNEMDDQMLEASARGENCISDLKVIEEIKSEAKEEVVRALAEKAEDLKQLMGERLGVGPLTTPTKLEKLDLELWPTEQQHRAMWNIGKGLGMSDVEIISTPQIVGTRGVENMEERTRDAMRALHGSKIPPDFRGEYRVNKIMFVNPEREKIDI